MSIATERRLAEAETEIVNLKLLVEELHERIVALEAKRGPGRPKNEAQQVGA